MKPSEIKRVRTKNEGIKTYKKKMGKLENKENYRVFHACALYDDK